jgi:hypothetical protein
MAPPAPRVGHEGRVVIVLDGHERRLNTRQAPGKRRGVVGCVAVREQDSRSPRAEPI